MMVVAAAVAAVWRECYDLTGTMVMVMMGAVGSSLYDYSDNIGVVMMIILTADVKMSSS